MMSNSLLDDVTAFHEPQMQPQRQEPAAAVPIHRKLIYVRMPMTFGKSIDVVDQNGAYTVFGDAIAYAAFAEGLACFAASGSDVTLIDSDGKPLIGSVDDLSTADRRAIAETLADAAVLRSDEDEESAATEARTRP